MPEFYCRITSFTVTSATLNKWRNLLKITTRTVTPAQQKMLKRYGVSTTDLYIERVTNALNNSKVNELNEIYNTAHKLDLEKNSQKEKDSLKKKLEKSFYKNSNNTVIRMLTEDDETDAINLYKLYKETMNEDIKKIKDDTEDFILKHIMFGIFVEDALVGFVIIKYSKTFKIDNNEEKVPTFYIQQMLIHPDNRGNKLSKYLLQYCIYRCPNTMKYISLMTMPENIAMQKIAESVGFIKQETISGDKKHSLLMIKNRDNVENSVNQFNENSTSS